METKANYVLIGLFTLAGILGALGLLLWLAKVEVDRQYAYYDIQFEDVSGLGAASDVRYNGLPVGQVVDLDLDPDDPSKVRVRIEVGADAPINAETRAQLQSQGVTGVSFVGLSGGSEDAAPLPEGAMIPSERSALQSVFEGAPEVLNKAVELLENVNDVFSDANKDAVGALVENLATSSARLDGVLANFETLSDDLGAAATQIAAFTGRLEALADTADTTLTTATETLGTATGALTTVNDFTAAQLVPLAEDLRATSQAATQVIGDAGTELTRMSGRIDQLADRGDVVLDTATQTFGAANGVIADIGTFTTQTLEPLGSELRTTAQSATRVIEQVGADTQRIAGRFDTLAGSATLALSDAQTTLQSVNTAATGFDQFMNDQMTLLSEDLRTTSQTVTRVVDGVGARALVLGDRVDTLIDEGSNALDLFTATLGNADETLEWVTSAMTSATDTLALASETFASANTLIREDVGGIIADLRMAASNFASTFGEGQGGIIDDLRGAANTFTTTVENVSANIDAISGEVLAASRSAARFAGTLDSVVSDNERQLSEFLRLGLPEFLRFTEEARSLTVNLERLVSKIERDPGRFLLGTQNSRFRR